jgi:hypothetical protein
MATIRHLCAKNDVNGNPQRLYALIDPEGEMLAVWDEGYYGSDAVPGIWRKDAYFAEREEISVNKYKKLLRDYPSPAYAYEVKGYSHLR